MSFDPAAVPGNSILTDPEYLLKNPGYIKQAHDLLVQYGIIPSPGSGFTPDADTQQEAEANPYSVAAMLRKGYATNLGNNATGAVSHGALYSGAYQNSNLHSLDAYQHDLSGAGTELQGKLGGVEDARTGTLASIWQRLSSAPVEPDLTPTAPRQAPAQVYAPLGTSTPKTVHDEGAPAYAQMQAQAPGAVATKIKKPGIGGLGHIT